MSSPIKGDMTKVGLELCAKTLANKVPFEIARVAFGSGSLPDGETPYDQTGLIKEEMEGTSSTPYYKGATVTMTLEANNASEEITEDVLINEMIVQVKDPTNNDELVTVYYATLGGQVQVLPAHDDNTATATCQYPISLIIGNGQDMVVAYEPSAALTDETARQLMENDILPAFLKNEVANAIKAHDESSEAHKYLQELITKLGESIPEETRTVVQQIISEGAFPTGGIQKIIAATIEPDDWLSDPNPVNGFIYYTDLTDDDVTADMVPDVTIAEASLNEAYTSGVSQVAETYKGYVRLKTTKRPTNAITVSCALQAQSTGGGGTYTLPVATATTLGGIKAGDGLAVASDGTASVDNAAVSQDAIEKASSSAEDVEEMLDEVFGDTSETA